MTGIEEKTRFLLILNILLQFLDVSVSYGLMSLGDAKASPFVNAALESRPDMSGLLYNKALACTLLSLIYVLRHRREAMASNALTITACVYTCYAAAFMWKLWLL
jgi:hypothetical protein